MSWSAETCLMEALDEALCLAKGSEHKWKTTLTATYCTFCGHPKRDSPSLGDYRLGPTQTLYFEAVLRVVKLIGTPIVLAAYDAILKIGKTPQFKLLLDHELGKTKLTETHKQALLTELSMKYEDVSQT